LSLIIKSLCHHITDGERRRDLFNDLSLSIVQGECIALMGNSGSGKTTLLNLIAGLEPIQQGNIQVAKLALAQATDKQLAQLRKTHIGIIFQQFNLLSSLTVQENIEFSAKLSARFDQQHGLDLAQKLGIDSLLKHYPATLSGGEMQRVAIARALNARPSLLLADEPTGNLDDHNSQQVVEQLIELAKLNNTALLVVTHNPEIARRMDKTYRLSEGKLSLNIE
jgi:putative ABC transport system ATP-binding protein